MKINFILGGTMGVLEVDASKWSALRQEFGIGIYGRMHWTVIEVVLSHQPN